MLVVEVVKGNVIPLRSNFLSPPPPAPRPFTFTFVFVFTYACVHSRLGLFGLDKLKNVDRTVSLLSDALDETHK